MNQPDPATFPKSPSYWEGVDDGLRLGEYAFYMRNSGAIPFVACSFFGLFALRTTVIPLRVSEIHKKSELIFVGTAGKAKVRFEEGKKTIRTYVPFRVLKVLKGKAPEKGFRLRLEGGKVGEEVLRVPGMPRFEEGKTYLCFVRGNGKSLSPITGFWQGLLEIRTVGKRQVLVNQKGLELIGVKDDRFVFALRKANASKGPPAKRVEREVKPAHPNVEKLEQEMQKKKQRKVEVKRKGKPKLSPATPIYVPAEKDRGVRMSLDAFLKGME
jgi:hypothetical protein